MRHTRWDVSRDEPLVGAQFLVVQDIIAQRLLLALFG